MPIKVQKKDYATIFIGLGGTGKDAILQIKKKFRERLICDPVSHNPRRTAFLVLDGDNSSCGIGKPIEDSEYININVNGLASILDPENRPTLPKYIRTWLSPDLPPPLPLPLVPAASVRLVVSSCSSISTISEASSSQP